MGFKVSLWNQICRVKGSHYQWTWGPDILDNTDLLLPQMTAADNAPCTNTKTPASCWCYVCIAWTEASGLRPRWRTQTNQECSDLCQHLQLLYSPYFLCSFEESKQSRTKEGVPSFSNSSAIQQMRSLWQIASKYKFPPFSMKTLNANNSWIPLVWCDGKSCTWQLVQSMNPAFATHQLFSLKQLT